VERVAGPVHRLCGCDAVVEGVVEDGGWPALKVSLTTELGDVNVVTIACTERGVKHVRVDGEYLLGGASPLTAYYAFAALSEYVDYLLKGRYFEEADPLTKYLVLDLVEAADKAFRAYAIVKGLEKPPRLVKARAFLKELKHRLNTAITLAMTDLTLKLRRR
jgi:hypothetical protein